MFIEDDMIFDFDYIDPGVQSEVLKCFVEDNDVLLFQYMECNVEAYPDGEWTKFVTARTVHVGDGPEIPMKSAKSPAYWYRAMNDEELKQILEHEGITYWCCIAPKGTDIDHDYKFVLFAYEHTEYDGEETRALWVFENKEGLFETQVVPKLMQLKWFTEKRQRFTCPCCGYKTLKDEREGDICGICAWEDDPYQFGDPDLEGGENSLSLRRAQKNFEEIGASDPEFLPSVRKPNERDERDENWRPLT